MNKKTNHNLPEKQNTIQNYLNKYYNFIDINIESYYFETKNYEEPWSVAARISN